MVSGGYDRFEPATIIRPPQEPGWCSRFRPRQSFEAAAEDGRGDRTETNTQSLPIACTLAPGDRQERVRQLRKLTTEALLSDDRNGLVLALCYAPRAVERVRAMVAHEQHCCAFLNFEVRQHHDAVQVTITAPERSPPQRGVRDCRLAAGSASMPVIRT